MNCKNCGTEMLDGTDFCLSCGVNQSEIKPKMGWYAFLTYLYMPFSAFCAVFAGVLFMPNVQLNILRSIDETLMWEFIFLDNTSIKILFFVYGTFMFTMAAYYVYIFNSLVKYKKKTLRHLCAERILHFIFYITYMFVLIILIKGNLSTNGSELIVFFRNITSQLISLIIWLAVNVKYFNNRKHLFVN